MDIGISTLSSKPEISTRRHFIYIITRDHVCKNEYTPPVFAQHYCLHVWGFQVRSCCFFRFLG